VVFCVKLLMVECHLCFSSLLSSSSYPTGYKGESENDNGHEDSYEAADGEGASIGRRVRRVINEIAARHCEMIVWVSCCVIEQWIVSKDDGTGQADVGSRRVVAKMVRTTVEGVVALQVHESHTWWFR
jgi:hypothetical protein